MRLAQQAVHVIAGLIAARAIETRQSHRP